MDMQGSGRSEMNILVQRSTRSTVCAYRDLRSLKYTYRNLKDLKSAVRI